jgi:putative holliday junction resolvase
MRVLALDHGAVRTGVAVCDETGTVVRPVGVVQGVDGEAGLAELLTLIGSVGAGLIVVGLPVSLDGREHAQAKRARGFAARLTKAVDVPVRLYDERFTTKLADRRGGRAARDARAAATLLEDYLRYAGEQLRR